VPLLSSTAQPLRRLADIKIGNDRLRTIAAEFQPGLRIIAAQLADHVGEILVVDVADTLELRQFAFRDKV
jgi:hypothetical protein